MSHQFTRQVTNGNANVTRTRVDVRHLSNNVMTTAQRPDGKKPPFAWLPQKAFCRQLAGRIGFTKTTIARRRPSKQVSPLVVTEY